MPGREIAVEEDVDGRRGFGPVHRPARKSRARGEVALEEFFEGGRGAPAEAAGRRKLAAVAVGVVFRGDGSLNYQKGAGREGEASVEGLEEGVELRAFFRAKIGKIKEARAAKCAFSCFIILIAE